MAAECYHRRVNVACGWNGCTASVRMRVHSDPRRKGTWAAFDLPDGWHVVPLLAVGNFAMACPRHVESFFEQIDLFFEVATEPAPPRLPAAGLSNAERMILAAQAGGN